LTNRNIAENVSFKSVLRRVVMQKIPISLAAEGMVLARDVTRPDAQDGPPICGRGMELSAPLIDRLVNMGVQSLMVEGRPVQMEGQESLDEALNALDARFILVENYPLMMKVKEMFRTVIERAMGG
jgi:hypothetical protein